MLCRASKHRIFGGHHFQELLEVDGPGAILIDIGDHFLDFLLFRLETEGAHGDLEFLGVDGATAVRIEQVEGFDIKK